MPRWQRAYVCGTFAVIGFALAYVLADYGAWPRLLYFPYEHRFAVGTGGGGRISMAYWGLFLWGLGGALVAGGLGAGLTMAWKKPLPPPAFGLLAGWAMTAFVLAGTYYTWNLWPF